MNDDPSAFLFSASRILEYIQQYKNDKALTDRQQAIDNIAAVTTVSDEEKKELLQLYYNSRPPYARKLMVEENASKTDQEIAHAEDRFKEFVKVGAYDDELIKDIKWLVEMNFYISYQLLEQCGQKLSAAVPKNIF